MTEKNTYKSSDIQVLTDIEHVRKRTQIYLGSMHGTEYSFPVFNTDKIEIHQDCKFTPSVLKSFGEIVDNSIDEFSQVYSKNHKLIVKADTKLGKYTITDNGRGVPIDMHETGKHTPEVVFSILRSGRNFEDDKKAGVIGQNGVGSSCVNFISKEFKIKINRDKKQYKQVFENGCSFVGKPIISKGSTKTGTEISFQLDDTVFTDISLPNELVKEKCRAIAFTNPGIEVVYNDESFKYKKGLQDIIPDDTTHFRFAHIDNDRIFEFFVCFDSVKSENEQIFTWLNSSLLLDGGSCNTQFMNAFTDKVISHLAKEAKKQKCKVTRNDIRENLLILGNIKISDPEFDSQSKLRLVGPYMRLDMDELIDKSWSLFVRRNKDWFEEIMKRAHRRHHTKANQNAIKDHLKSNRKRVDGFKDCTSKNRMDCTVFITEGQSASAEISTCRDPEFHASFALTGKINNVYGSTPAQLLQMGKITNMLKVIGLVPGVKATKQNLNFGNICISTDSDVDGADIYSLLINIFYQFWPELFQMDIPIIHRLTAPNLVAYNKKDRVHFVDMDEFNKVQNKYKNHSIVYYKGLGSMILDDWKMILSNLETYCIPMKHDDELHDIIQLLFSDNTDARKEWLM